MGIDHKDLKGLSEPTPQAEVKKRPAPGGSGKMLSYIDARFVMDRLDEVVGPHNWANEFVEVHGGIVCRIGININDAGWVWKSDVGTESTIEATKGNYSDAFKRAAVHWGIARDLYDDRLAGGANKQAPRPAAPSAPTAAPQSAPSGDTHIADWKCPMHGTSRVIPAGVSRSSGKPYKSFVACATPKCDAVAPRGTQVSKKAQPVGFTMMAEGDDEF